MDQKLLIVQSPSTLPQDTPAEEVIDVFCQTNDLVLLMQFGDETYNLSPNYKLPKNAKIIEYSYETLEDSIQEFQRYLEGHGVHVVSRLERNRLPFIMQGSMLSLPYGTRLSVYDRRACPEQKTEKSVQLPINSEWDVL